MPTYVNTRPHTHTHTHKCIYIYIYICMYNNSCISKRNMMAFLLSFCFYIFGHFINKKKKKCK